MAASKVSKLIRVRTGRNLVELELIDGKLAIQVGDSKKVTINKEAVNVLRDMLGITEMEIAPRPKLATILPPGSIREGEALMRLAPPLVDEHVSPDLDGPGDFKEGMA